MHKLHVSMLAAALIAGHPQSGFAWGATGHRIISTVAIEALPDEVPAFLRTADSAATLGELGREPDRSRGAGMSHDRDLDPGHYLDLGDDGRIGDAVSLAALPPTRETYDTALRAKGIDQYRAGYLPYSIIDGWQQLRKDFAYWRTDVAGTKFATSAADRSWYERDRRLHEMLVLRDAGYWSHFVADGSQPMHVSVHHNGWGNYDNPEQFTQSPTVHADFEGRYVSSYIRPEQVMKDMPGPAELGCDIEQQVPAYLRATGRQLVPLYRLIKSHGLAGESREMTRFTLDRLAAGAAEFRDLVVSAWQCSRDISVGYPAVPVREIESGRINPIRELRGRD